MTMRAGDYWENALSVQAYLDQMTQNRDLFERRIETTQITAAEREAFRGDLLRFLVLTEDFCGDSAQFIPPVIRLARELPNIEVRLLLRDQHRELGSRYVRKDGYQAIPVLIVLNAAGEELGYLVERPARVNAELAAETRRFAKENARLDGVSRTYDKMAPETRAAVRANANRFRDAQQARWSHWLLEDLADIAGRATGAIATTAA
ncbi:MAG: thioredoxin family protein [Vicinamibacterales bacterium]